MKILKRNHGENSENCLSFISEHFMAFWRCFMIQDFLREEKLEITEDVLETYPYERGMGWLLNLSVFLVVLFFFLNFYRGLGHFIM